MADEMDTDPLLQKYRAMQAAKQSGTLQQSDHRMHRALQLCSNLQWHHVGCLTQIKMQLA
jgi:hypothetical protein